MKHSIGIFKTFVALALLSQNSYGAQLKTVNYMNVSVVATATVPVSEKISFGLTAKEAVLAKAQNVVQSQCNLKGVTLGEANDPMIIISHELTQDKLAWSATVSKNCLIIADGEKLAGSIAVKQSDHFELGTSPELFVVNDENRTHTLDQGKQLALGNLNKNCLSQNSFLDKTSVKYSNFDELKYSSAVSGVQIIAEGQCLKPSF